MNETVDRPRLTKVFGYGSLISRRSRAATLGRDSDATPVRVTGLVRCWGTSAPSMQMTALACVADPTGTTNGVMFDVTAAELQMLTGRETGYNLRPIERGAILSLASPQISSDAPAVAFLSAEVNLPSADMPIAQTYLDVVVSAAAEFGDDFATELVRSTTGWGAWVEDRRAPRYVRREEVQTALVDGILARTEPAASFFAFRKPL